jgi:CRISPR-associated endonuclease/helicase Cas3
MRVAEATRRLIAEHPLVRIPDDNRFLVEAATHPDCLREIEASCGDAWRVLGQQVEGDTGAQRGIGHLHALEVDRVFGDQGFPHDLDIATRLGTKDRLLHFDPPLPGPFGQPLAHLPVRHFLVPRELDPDARPEGLVHGGGIVEFSLGNARFRYGRLGLERLKDD